MNAKDTAKLIYALAGPYLNTYITKTHTFKTHKIIRYIQTLLWIHIFTWATLNVTLALMPSTRTSHTFYTLATHQFYTFKLYTWIPDILNDITHTQHHTTYMQYALPPALCILTQHKHINIVYMGLDGFTTACYAGAQCFAPRHKQQRIHTLATTTTYIVIGLLCTLELPHNHLIGALAFIIFAIYTHNP